MIEKNGGPAFPMPMGHNGMPHFEEHEYNHAEPGMTLRDWFAGMALQGLLANPKPVQIVGMELLGMAPFIDAHAFSALAYSWADAMIAERQDKTPEVPASAYTDGDDAPTTDDGMVP